MKSAKIIAILLAALIVVSPTFAEKRRKAAMGPRLAGFPPGMRPAGMAPPRAGPPGMPGTSDASVLTPWWTSAKPAERGDILASCVVKITSDAEILPLNDDILTTLANSPFIKRETDLADFAPPKPSGLSRKVDLRQSELQEVLHDLREMTDLNIVVLWGDLEQTAGIYPDDLVMVHLNQVSAGKALDRVLDYVSGGKRERAVYYVDEEGIVTIGPWSELAGKMKQGPSELAIGVYQLSGRVPSGRQDGLFRMEIYGPTDGALSKDAAGKYLRTVCSRLEKVLQPSFKEEIKNRRQRLELLEQEIRGAADGRGRAEHEVRERRERQQKLLQQAGQADLGRDAIFARTTDLERQKQELAMELTAQRARRAALHEHVSHAAAEAEDRLRNDAILAELKEIVESRKRMKTKRAAEMLRDVESLQRALNPELDRLRSQFGSEHRRVKAVQAQIEKLNAKEKELREKAGTASPSDPEIVEGIARARIDVARREEELRRSAGGEQMQEFNHQLAALSIDSAELEARLRFVREQLEQIREKHLLRLADEFEDAGWRLGMARERFEKASHRLDEMRRQMERQSSRVSQPPTVTILGGELEAPEPTGPDQPPQR